MQPDDPRHAQVSAWLASLASDLRTIDVCLATQPPVLRSVLFHAQQAAEKALKAFLTWHSVPFRKTHQLQDLVGQCCAIDQSFDALDQAAEQLTPYAWQYRYPGDLDEPVLEQARGAEQMARTVVGFVREHLPPEVLT